MAGLRKPLDPEARAAYVRYTAATGRTNPSRIHPQTYIKGLDSAERTLLRMVGNYGQRDLLDVLDSLTYVGD